MRLEQRHELTIQELGDGGKDQLQRDERDIDTNEVDRFVKIARFEKSRVDLLANDNLRIVSQRGVKLPVADVDRINLCRAVFQEDVSESAR